MTEAPATDQVRALAMALPGVTKKLHLRFKAPLWQVRGRTIAHTRMGRDGATAVFCITEESANAAAAAGPGHAAEVRRMNAQGSFLGLEAQLAGAAPEGQRASQQPAGVLELGDLLIEGRKALADDRWCRFDRPATDCEVVGAETDWIRPNSAVT